MSVRSRLPGAAVILLLVFGLLACETEEPKQTRRPAGREFTTAAIRGTDINLALGAKVTASSYYTEYGDYMPDRATDEGPGEWATAGQKAGSWIQLTWDSPTTIGRVELEDRVSADDFVTGGHLEFSDGGSAAPVPSLNNDGTPLEVVFKPRNVTWVRFVIDSVSKETHCPGLREFRVFGTETK